MKKKDNYNSNMCPSLSKINSNIGSITFFAKSHPGDVCGSNGLPLTPNSIAILGRAQRLKAIKHQNLCEYLDFIRGKHERTIIVSEYTGIPLEGKYKGFTIDRILKILYQIADGLNEIHNHGIVTHNLDPTTILLDDNDNVKLFNYGLFYMTNYGEYVSFPIGNVKYMPPERLLGSKNNIKSDIWSLGIVIAELLLECEFWSTLKLSNIIRRILSLNNTQNVFEKIAREHNCYDKYQNLNSNIKQLIEKCLLVNVKNRLIPSDILNSELFINENNDLDNKTITNIHNDDNNKISLSLSSSSSSSSSLLSSLQQVSKKIITPLTTNELLLRCCPLQQIYYLWQLAGGDVQTELKKEGLIRSEAPILSVPRIVCLNGQIIGPKRSQSYLVDNRVVMLRLNNLRERLKTIPYTAYFPLIHSPKISFKYTNHGMDQLPLIIRERDTEYQFHRTMLFYRLLKGYPFTRDLIVQEAEIDIPPLLRGQVWACLLDVIPNGMYDQIDKVTPTSTDRQIEVDIPRCHQYDELLSSPEGHRKLKRLLKAWVTSHPEYVYWQGLDSLTAPFLYLNFNDEELAFLSVYKFIPKYLHWFFLKDNSAIIKEYLCKFSQLTAFHEPLLAKHLNGINFIPELFAIPWFLTMFSHVFPLHKIIHLWDRLMLGDNSFPLFIGISVLKQLKNTLLSSGFNECILLFSDLPDIVMDTCVIDSQKMYSMTPKSICYRQHVVHIIEPGEFDINDITLNELQSELCPRISVNDLIDLLYNEPDRVAIIDIRGIQEYTRSHVIRSINVPFTTVLLGDTRLESLNVPNLDEQLNDRIVVILSTVHENAKLFSKFLVDCGVYHVCILHKGFDILHSVVPNILVSS